jgi:predicted transcriptional regulator of viral defense system
MSKMLQLLEIAEKGPFRASDATDRGIPRSYLQRALEAGSIERVGYGLYRASNADVTEGATVAEVVTRAQNVVVCLLTALQFHELTSEVPHAVWIMVEGTRRAPKIDFVKTEVVRASGRAFSHGVEEIVIEGARMKITDPAKTVADCFRYRSHVGMEVAYTALRDFIRRVHERRGGKYTLPRLVEAAKVDHVYRLMRPSIEVLV